MKEIITFLLLLSAGTGISQSTDDSKLVTDFFEIIVKKDSTDVGALLPYLDYSGIKLERSQDVMIQMITFYAFVVNGWIKDHHGEYKIYPHHSVANKFTERYSLQYNDLENVYYVVSEDKIVTPIIVKNGKIISFFTGLIQGTKKVHPVLLN